MTDQNETDRMANTWRENSERWKKLTEDLLEDTLHILVQKEQTETSMVSERKDRAELVRAIEYMDTKMTRLSADGEFVTVYQVMAGPWHRILGLARGALALDESPSSPTSGSDHDD
jgi:hypothetical protein